MDAVIIKYFQQGELSWAVRGKALIFVFCMLPYPMSGRQTIKLKLMNLQRYMKGLRGSFLKPSSVHIVTIFAFDYDGK